MGKEKAGMSTKSISVIAVFMLLLSVCEAQIRCYSCATTGINADKCGDKFSRQQEPAYCLGSCMKIRGYRNSGRGDELEIHRGCANKEDEHCSDGQDYFGMKAEICYCNEELCNTGSVVVISKWKCVLTTAFSVVLALFLHH